MVLYIANFNKLKDKKNLTKSIHKKTNCKRLPDESNKSVKQF